MPIKNSERYYVLIYKINRLWGRLRNCPASFPRLLDRLKQLAKELCVSENIRFPGTIDRSEVPAYFYLCDIFILPAVFDPQGNVDGCPNVILEAMACGKPVIASAISGIPVVVKDGETGILVEEKNISQLADALVRLLTDKPKREQLGCAGKQRILNELTWDQVIKQIKGVYLHSVKSNIQRSPAFNSHSSV